MKIIFLIGAILAEASGVAIEKWYNHQGNHFYIETENKFNWYNAWNECARKNMSLMAIDSPRKHWQIETLMKSRFPNGATLWSSGNDMGIERRYEWSTTGETLTFTNWAPGQPTRTTATDRCIAIEQNTWTWYVRTCTVELGFICEENHFIKTKSKELETMRNTCYNTTATTFENVVVYINSDTANNITDIKDREFLKLNMGNIIEN